MKPIWKQDHEGEGNELWLGVPTWDPDNRRGQLSIKFAYRVNGRIPRTAPEVPERVITPMLVMLGDHGRLKPEEIDQIEALVNRVRGKRPNPGVAS
jgi:hypothetical protein